ncbi:hypothetical protein [Pseudomonas sp. RC2C2]|uniref:hypothetical protein n=1 Tax=Pseudomonas sp. RC2C2 TaxID=2834408 RepID=UPI001BCFD37E|nr:hypothetical protein [Pseudomonas sp. RC2C2]MBS7599484.1 hypothetical protein [Pseudomonas sp. RC2C2]
MDLCDFYEVATEDLIYSTTIGSADILYSYLESHGYVVTFRYTRHPETSELERRFYLIDYHCGRLRDSYGSISEESKKENLEQVIEHLKKEYNNVKLQYFEIVEPIEPMYLLSLKLRHAMPHCQLLDEESFVELYESAVLPFVQFITGQLERLPTGREDCYKYEKLIGIFLNIYFLSAGFRVTYQIANASNQHRRDFFVRVKRTTDVDFNELIVETQAKSIVVECKNSIQKKEFIDAVSQVEKYSKASSFGKLGMIFTRKKCDIFKLIDYTKSPCTIIVMDDSDIRTWLFKISTSYSYYKRHKNKEKLLQDIDGCSDFFERYQEICEK